MNPARSAQMIKSAIKCGLHFHQGVRVNITIPVYNEQAQLETSVLRVLEFAQRRLMGAEYEIIIADNASTDRTSEMAKALADQHSSIGLVQLSDKGRGRAVKRVWAESTADILTYMDVDLSTDLCFFPALVDAIASGDYDIAVGSRLLCESRTIRGIKREVISRGYNLLIKAMFRTRFSDAQCGFKAVSRAVVARLLPWIRDDGWFMDSELLIVAEKLGYRIRDIPVHWRDDPESRVKILRTAVEDIKGLIRVRRSLANGGYAASRAPNRARASTRPQAAGEDSLNGSQNE